MTASTRPRLAPSVAVAIVASAVLLAAPAEAFGCLTDLQMCTTHCVYQGYATSYRGWIPVKYLQVPPIDVPEILQNIFLHLDQSTLTTCARVSQFWRALSLNVAAHAFIPSKDTLKYLARPKEQDNRESEPIEANQPIGTSGAASSTRPTFINNAQSQGTKDFQGRCPGLRSLTIGDSWNGKEKYGSAFDVGKVIQWQSAVPAGLTNLVRLDLRLVCASQPYRSSNDMVSLPDQVFRDILAQNPLIEELYYASGDEPGYAGLKILLHYPLQHLRRLTLQLTDHAWNFLEFWVLLVQRDKLHERLRKENPKVLASLRDTVPDTQQKRAALLKALPNWNLEELTIRNANHKKNDLPFHGFLRDALFDERAPIYQLSLRSLTLEGFDIHQYKEPKYSHYYDLPYGYDDDSDEEQENRSVLYHLFRRLPHLERLRISPDHTNIRKPSPLPIKDIIRTTIPEVRRKGRLRLQWDISEQLVRFCPHIKAIDLSYQREVLSMHWDDLLKAYAPRLESLVCWGIGRRDVVDSDILLHLIPPTPAIVLKMRTHPSQNWVGLQELDISANTGWGNAVHMFLKYVPTLRILRALGVPVDGTGLVGYDWVCEDMEILAINIKVPVRFHRISLEPWSWDVWRGKWARTPSVRAKNEEHGDWLYCDGGTIKDAHTRLSALIQQGKGGCDEKSENEDDYMSKLFDGFKAAPGYKESEARRRRLESKRYRTAEEEEFLRFCSQRDFREEDQVTVAMARWRVNNRNVKAERHRKNTEYNTQVQQQLCQQLGRLVKLRELTLEGERYYEGEYKKRLEFDSLHLSLETGLNYLRPLQANLEKLVVYRLDERLSGGAEVEWIAKNWVHHTDPVWQHTFETWDRQSYLDIPDEGVNRVTCPSSKFRQLIGVHLREQVGLTKANAAGNIAWLEYYCPQLVVVKDVTKAKKHKGGENLSSSETDSGY
ncbi:hypothetical protein BGW39_010670 [Mortierella sp. 14UC]|nr:hypothetical protein BGW39_010670 [Mortierella sp. 14UC]